MTSPFNRENLIRIGDGRFTFSIVGEARYQHELDQMELFAGAEFPVFLRTEPSNEHDHLAIAVFAAFEIPLGYFPHEDAVQHWEMVAQLEKQGVVSCNGKIIGGPERGPGYSYGLVIDFPDSGWQKLAGHMDGTSRKNPRPKQL